MALAFASLGSGSKGNGTIVEGGSGCVLIDCGFSVKETERRLSRLGRSGEDLSAILVTHEHSDHIRGVLPLARKYRLPVMMTRGTAAAVAGMNGYEKLTLIAPHQCFYVDSLEITPVTVRHDAREPVQFVIGRNQRKVGVLTDLGSITQNVIDYFDSCDGLLLEANHDQQLLLSGQYPYYLKQRVGGDWGHLNNYQSASLLSRIERRKIQTLVLGHISLKNNSWERISEAVSPYIETIGNVVYACQEQGFSWQVIE
ncbi:MAG: MBL fold metallo-hydrolase [Porticoccaceae bacterium]